jgi:hypothetical protein
MIQSLSSWVGAFSSSGTVRRQAAGVFSQLALSARGPAMVGGEDARPRLARRQENVATEAQRTQRRFDAGGLWNRPPEAAALRRRVESHRISACSACSALIVRCDVTAL